MWCIGVEKEEWSGEERVRAIIVVTRDDHSSTNAAVHIRGIRKEYEQSHQI